MRGRRRDPLDGQGHLGCTYTSGGVRKISINYAGWTTNGGAVPTDSVVRSYSGDGTRIQKLTWSGVYDYKDGTAYRVRNPRNPASAPGKAKIKITLGVDGDGHGNCSVTFTQPDSAGGGGGGSASDRYEADVVSGTNAERTSRELQALSSEACVDLCRAASGADGGRAADVSPGSRTHPARVQPAHRGRERGVRLSERISRGGRLDGIERAPREHPEQQLSPARGRRGPELGWPLVRRAGLRRIVAARGN
jgi:hypothetical protein